MSVPRQAHLAAGLILAAAFALSLWVARAWIYLALVPTFGLLLHALTGICPVLTVARSDAVEREPAARGAGRYQWDGRPCGKHGSPSSHPARFEAARITFAAKASPMVG